MDYQNKEGKTKIRARFYSSMSYDEFERVFGVVPKMPDAPLAKPLTDPQDIPPLSLEDETEQSFGSLKPVPEMRLFSKMETIPEIEGSENNSVACASYSKKFDTQLFPANNRSLDYELADPQIYSVKRQRSRPRSLSENAPRFQIIDFLSNLNGPRARKQAKKQ